LIKPFGDAKFPKLKKLNKNPLLQIPPLSKRAGLKPKEFLKLELLK